MTADTITRQTLELRILARDRGCVVAVVDLAPLGRLAGLYVPHPPRGLGPREVVGWLARSRRRPDAEVLQESLDPGPPLILIQESLPPEQHLRALAHEVGHLVAPASLPRKRAALESYARTWARAFLTHPRWTA